MIRIGLGGATREEAVAYFKECFRAKQKPQVWVVLNALTDEMWSRMYINDYMTEAQRQLDVEQAEKAEKAEKETT